MKTAKMKVITFVLLCAAALVLSAQTARTPAPIPENFVQVEGGVFKMGSGSGGHDEKPVHRIRVKSFYMAKYEVTQKEWLEIMGTTVRRQRDMEDTSYATAGEGDNYPMYYVSWQEAVEYCNKRSEKEGLAPAYRSSGDTIECNFYTNGYRLPTEAEWEFAAKGGEEYAYSGSDNADTVAWHNDYRGGNTRPVGTKAPNSLGIYDMSGNVQEWCWDRYGPYSQYAREDPRGASTGTERVLRGGCVRNSAYGVRSAGRYRQTPDYRMHDTGFRLVRTH